MKTETTYTPISGYLILLVALLILAASVWVFIWQLLWLIPLPLIGLFLLGGLVVVNPNESPFSFCLVLIKARSKNGFSG